MTVTPARLFEWMWKLIIIIPVFMVIGSCILLGWFFWGYFTSVLYGYVDTRGHFVIPPKYSYAENFKNGKANVSSVSDEWHGSISDDYVLDSTGQIFSHKRSYDYDGTYYRYTEDLVDKGGKATLHPALRERLSFREDDALYPVPASNSENKFGYKNKDGTWFISPQFDNARNFYNGVAWVQVPNFERHWGLNNKKAEFLLPPKCREAGEFYDGLALCKVKVYFGMFY